MDSIETLRSEHVGIGLMANSLATLAKGPIPSDCLELFRARGDLRRALLSHLSREDWVVYPRMLASNRPEVRALATRLAAGAAAFTSAFQAYSRRWTTPSITADWEGFRDETLAMLAALKRRISCEDDELYALVEGPDGNTLGKLHFA